MSVSLVEEVGELDITCAVITVDAPVTEIYLEGGVLIIEASSLPVILNRTDVTHTHDTVRRIVQVNG